MRGSATVTDIRDASILKDFAANETGWTIVEQLFTQAHADFLKRAAFAATHDEHLRCLGKLEGLEHAMSLIQKSRTAMKRE